MNEKHDKNTHRQNPFKNIPRSTQLLCPFVAYLEMGWKMVGQKALEGFAEKKIKIIADHREVPSGVVHELMQLGVEVEARKLSIGDFILSDRVGIERKSVDDFLQSIVDKRLLGQPSS